MALRRRATACAWRERARCEAARRGIFFRALSAARARSCVARSVRGLERAAGRFEADRRAGDVREAPVFRDEAALRLEVDLRGEDLRAEVDLRAVAGLRVEVDLRAVEARFEGREVEALRVERDFATVEAR